MNLFYQKVSRHFFVEKRQFWFRHLTTDARMRGGIPRVARNANLSFHCYCYHLQKQDVFPICILATSSSDGWCLSFANFPKGSSVRLCCFGHSNSGLWQQWLLARIINHNSNFSRLHFTRPHQFLEFQWKQKYLVPYSWVIELNRV